MLWCAGNMSRVCDEAHNVLGHAVLLHAVLRHAVRRHAVRRHAVLCCAGGLRRQCDGVLLCRRSCLR